MINETLNYTVNQSMIKVIDCGTIKYDLASKVSFVFKLSIFVTLGLLIFEWWAISKIIASKESNERKKFLIDFCMIFCKGVMLLMLFNMIYWVFLAGIDF